MEIENTLVNWLFGIGATVITGGGAALYRGIHARIKRAEESIKEKADEKDIERMHENLTALWTEVKSVRQDMNDGFMSVRQGMHETELRIIERLPRG